MVNRADGGWLWHLHSAAAISAENLHGI
jgi:hypothetical protein